MKADARSSSKQGRKATQRAAAARMQLKREAQHRRQRRRVLLGVGAALVLVGLVVALVVSLGGGGLPKKSASAEVAPPPVTSGTPDVQQPALVVLNTTGIPGVTAYDTAGWPADSQNGPPSSALGHTHVTGPVTYSVTPPVGGDHNAEWMNCGVYSTPVPKERAVHNLEHGAVWITYQPSLPASEVSALRSFQARQSVVGSSGSRYVDLSPYPGLPSPIVISSWGFQLRVSSPNDPRLQQFVDMFRASPRYAPEYGSPCTGGVGTPLQS